MRKLWVLLKLNFRAMLRAFSFRSGAGSSQKKAAGGLGALLLLAFLAQSQNSLRPNWLLSITFQARSTLEGR